MSKRLASELDPRPTEPIPLEFERREFQPVQCGSPPGQATRWYEPHPPLYRPIEDPEPDDELQDEDQGDGYYGYSREDDFVVPATEDDYYEMRLAQSWAKRGWEPPSLTHCSGDVVSVVVT